MSNLTTESLLFKLSALTPARVSLGRAESIPTITEVLSFQLSHARAREEIFRPADFESVQQKIENRTPNIFAASSRAPDRSTYLRRPDLGRLLNPADRVVLPRLAPKVLIVVADGLSAAAVETYAGDVVNELQRHFATSTSSAPVVFARQSRVALGDEIAEAMDAEAVVVLIGERPGLSITDSLGAYITFRPKPGLLDSRRNCVSNIHGKGGLSPSDAASKIVWLLARAKSLGTSGVQVKDESPTEFAPVQIAPDTSGHTD